MSAEIINLSKARKAREKEKTARTSAENRARFGRSKVQKTLAKLQEEINVRRLDLAKRTARNDDGPAGAKKEE
jgi:hypothetical protein